MIGYVVLVICMGIFTGVLYLKTSKGVTKKERIPQLAKFFLYATLAFAPAVIVKLPITSPLVFLPTIVSVILMLTYPILFYRDNKNSSPDFSFRYDIVFGFCLIACFISLETLLLQIPPILYISTVFISLSEWVILLISIAQVIYYILYKECISENGMQLLQETNYNEIIGYFKSMPKKSLGVFLFSGSIFSVLLMLNINAFSEKFSISYVEIMINIVVFVIVVNQLFVKKTSSLVNSGIGKLYFDIKKYREANFQYVNNMQERIKDLHVKELGGKYNEPKTIILVIGESASRDYLKAFNESYKYETTPWLSEQGKKNNFILFPNAYSTIANTVIACSNAFTEMNQYNDKKFYESCSFVDIARKLGYKIHWYSNQGHFGYNDTPVTLVADTADIAKWTKQELNKVQYDEALIDYLDEVDPNKNNLVVIHFKGSHEIYLNRYPESFTKFGVAGKLQLEENYANSIAYSDYVLEKIYNYGKEKLNLQAVVYFSDHGAIPDRRRSPKFEGMASVRIPLFVYLADEYIEKNKDIYENLQQNRERYWTNDLAYDLLCSIFNVSSNRFDESNSIASTKYRYQKEDLLTNNGKTKII